jgi:zinc protease
MMTSPRKLAAIALLAVGLVTPIGVAGGAEPPVERLTLDNGLTVYLRPIKGAKQVALVVLYSIGSDHDPAGKSGLSHLAEHIYLTAAAGGAKARTTEEMQQRYPEGANGQTGDRSTMITTTFPEAELDEEVRDAAARMGDLRVTPDDVERERPRVVEEVGNMFGNIPALAAQNHARELIRPTPAGGRHGGDPGSIKAIRTLDVQEHLGRFYRPRNAIVSIAGGFDPARAKQAILAHFAKLAAGEKASSPREPGAPGFGVMREIKAEFLDPDDRPMACLVYLAPSPQNDLYAPFLVLITRLWSDAEKLGGGAQNLFPVYFTPMGDGAVVGVSSPLKPGETSKQAFARLEAFVAETVKPGLQPNEAASALQMLGSLFQTLPVPDDQLARNPYGVAFALGRLEQMKIDPARFNKSFEAVTDDSLRKAAAAFFDPARHAAAFVGN